MTQFSKDTAVIFLHIPKIGGRTLRKVIEREYKRTQIHVIDGPMGPGYQNLVALTEEEKRRLRAVVGQMGVGVHEILPQPSTYITMLRDPVERAISYYAYIQRSPAHTHHRRVVENNLSLHDFVVQRVSLSGTDNGQTRMLGGGPDAGEHIPFGGVTREHLDVAKRNLRELFSVVGVLESFDDVIFLLHTTFGWKTPWYVRENVGTNRDQMSAIQPETLALLDESSQLDLELHAYAKELLKKQLAAQPAVFHARRSAFKAMTQYPRLRSLYARIRP